MYNYLFRFQNVELIGAYVCATDLSSIVSNRSDSSIDNKLDSSIVGVITSVTENCYFIASISSNRKKILSETNESSFDDKNLALCMKKRLKKNTALAVAIPDDRINSKKSTPAVSISKDTSIFRRGIMNYINGANSDSDTYLKILPGLAIDIINFENVIMVYGK